MPLKVRLEVLPELVHAFMSYRPEHESSSQCTSYLDSPEYRAWTAWKFVYAFNESKATDGIAPFQAVFAAIRFPAVGSSAGDQAVAFDHYIHFPAAWPPPLFFGTLLFRVVAATLPRYSDCGRTR